MNAHRLRHWLLLLLLIALMPLRGALEMGGMFSVVKVRDDLKPGDYRDPGWYRHPRGSVAYEYAGDALARSRRTAGRHECAQAQRP